MLLMYLTPFNDAFLGVSLRVCKKNVLTLHDSKIKIDEKTYIIADKHRFSIASFTGRS